MPLALVVLAGLFHVPPANAEESQTVPVDRALVVEAWRNGGPHVRAMAELALVDTDDKVRSFIAEGLEEAELIDQRDAVAAAVADGGPAVAAAATAAMDAADAGTAGALAMFLSEGWASAANIDLRVQVNQLMAAGGEQVREAAQVALDSEDPARLQEFLDSGWQKQWQTDQRLQVNRVLATGGTRVKAAAQKALDNGTPAALEEFLTYGWDVAAAQDEETETLTGLLEQAKVAAAEVDRETEKVKTESARAKAGAAAAKRWAEEAADATGAARDNAANAKAHAKRAAAAARKAAQSAQTAIEAASIASSAARRASAAATRASRAAAQAAGVASDAYKAASIAAKDKTKAADARAAAEKAGRIAEAAEDLAAKANNTAQSLEKAQNAIDAAEEAAAQALLAVNANNRAADYAKQANADATEAVQAAAVAKANAERAMRAVVAARKHMAVAIKHAYAARDAANAAAADARRAASAAFYAADTAMDATDAALLATAYANDAVTAANKVVDLGKQAFEVYTAAREADAERLAVVTDAAMESARLANTTYEAQQKKADWDLEQAAQRNAATNTLIAEALNPATDPVQAVIAGRKAALALVGATGIWTRHGALAALEGDGADVLGFLRTGLTRAVAQDNRIAVMDLAVTENTALAAAAQTALASTDAAVAQFLKTQSYSGRATQDRLKINQLLASARTAGRTVTMQRAQVALDNGTLQVMRDFLDTGYATASAIDDRVQVNQIIADPDSGPEVKAAAQVALDGPLVNLPDFLESGQYTAIERDNDQAVHLATVLGLLEKTNALGATAVQRAQEAQATAAHARGDAAKANEYAQQAILSAEEAIGYAAKANDYATQAAASAKKAADAAQTAQSAAVKANAAARSAVRSATWAAASRQHAKESADAAHKIALQAKEDALDAGADAEAASAAALAAYADYEALKGMEIVNCEHKYMQEPINNFENFWGKETGNSWRNCVANIIGDPQEMARRSYINSAYCDGYYSHPAQSQLYQNCVHATLDPDFEWMVHQDYVTNLINGISGLVLTGAAGLGALCILTVVCAEVLGAAFTVGDVGLNIYRFLNGDQTLGETLLNLGQTAVESLVFKGLSKLGGATFRRLKSVYQARENSKKVENLLGLTNSIQLKFDRLIACVLDSENSFSADTPVRLADGTDKPISQVQVGDRVLTTDPSTGTTEDQPVTALYENTDTQLTDLTVRQESGTSAIVHTTTHHPVWNASDSEWADAGELTAGTRIRTADGRPAWVSAVRTFTGRQTMYNLTVARWHTYYVLAGGTAVLVHNANKIDKHDCADIVLGLKAPLNGVGNDALAAMLRDRGIDARTYNGTKFGQVPEGEKYPYWMKYVRAAYEDTNVTLHITVDGLDGTDAFDKIRTATRRGGLLSDEQAMLGDGTNWEMSRLFTNLVLGFFPDPDYPPKATRELRSIRFYQNGVDISEELWPKFPSRTDLAGWLDFKNPRR